MLIDCQEDLVTVCDQAAKTPFCAVDVEFNRRNTYAPEVSLVQIAGEGIPTSLLDVIPLDDVSPITAFITSPECVKVIHSCSQDLEAFSVLCDAQPINCIDTQIAAAFCGMGFQLGFSSFVNACLGKDIDKKQQTSNWMRRPLSPAQLEYAAADVDDLLECYAIVRDKLVAADRFEWVREECNSLLKDFMEKQFEQRVNPSRVSGAGRLKPRAYTLLGALMVWREKLAIRRDRPCQWMVPNPAMIEIAEVMPESMSDIERLDRLTPKQKSYYGVDIIKQVQHALELPKHDLLPSPDLGQLAPQEKKCVRKLSEFVRRRADEVEIASQLLASSKDIKHLVRFKDYDQSPVLSGWRKQLLGDGLLKILEPGH